ncbi:hypothetical protein PR202_ga08489 [Eleusine coracana subsp. coracana]|uniref:Auxin efflux carrier component n=1 Tax=Eleusine coracana subsp. coracana TaxID=191504 RepID=A0AAV5C1J0_ELECO|nr:hypothetical protein PR202_ga08489 [Eleusine coracana subsp. coracana]
MIGWSDVSKVVAATVPLYFALFLGYGSVRWWRIFTREQCDAVNRLVAFFALPFFTFELHIELPSAFEGSVLIMSKSGTGMAMFSMGLFMAQQEKVLACGPSFAALGLVLKFALGPAAMAIGSIAVGLRGDVLRLAIIQAALPQSITSFIFAKEYGLHADVLSTAVIFGMLVSLPLLVGFYIVLEFIR